MGINLNGLRFLLYAKAQGADFSKTAMLGRQGLHLAYEQFCHVICNEFGYIVPKPQLQKMYKYHYADELLYYLGAEEVHSFDASDYEGGTHIHDFNLEIDSAYFENYTCLIDGGSLEHIFNFPIAVKNCMNMLVKGGCFLGITPANNYPGHGFYQFSPELFYLLFSDHNGFETQDIFLHEGREAAFWHRVKNMTESGQRVTFRNKKETLMLIFARRVSVQNILQHYPNQFDYLVSWGEEASKPQKYSTLSLIKKIIPVGLKKKLKKHWQFGLRPPLFAPFYPHLSVPRINNETIKDANG